MQLLRGNSVVCGVGTPARVADLIAGGALTLRAPCVLVLDAAAKDGKKRSMFEVVRTN